MLKSHQDGEAGASAVFIAMVMVLLLGVAAVTIDLTGMGFNERRQDQTAADTGAMAGAFGYLNAEDDVTKVAKALQIIRANLDTIYTDAEWQAMWNSCTDDLNGVDVGTGVGVDFFPMPRPWDPSNDLQCVSSASSYIRVRIPDQAIDTTFGRVLGFDQIRTAAAAIARIEPLAKYKGLLPFGIPGGTGAGELCLSTNPSGTAQPPCQGPNGGGFGAINAELFGDFFGTPSCSNPGLPELEQNTALGMDHFVDKWPGTVSPGSTHPGDGAILAYPGVSYDACTISAGTLEPEVTGQSFPPNTVRVDTGFSQSGPVENGLISNNLYLGQPSRLQNTPNPTRPVVKKRTGGADIVYPVDNKGPWAYLTGNGVCDPASYTGLTTDLKVAMFHTCLTTYSGTTDIFDVSIGDSPRFGFAPQYWHAPATTGKSWQPVMEYDVVFLAGLWFNCSATPGSCGATFYPDEDFTSEVCEAFAGGCKELSLDQMSAWVLPKDAIPDTILSSFPGGPSSPFAISLFR